MRECGNLPKPDAPPRPFSFTHPEEASDDSIGFFAPGGVIIFNSIALIHPGGVIIFNGIALIHPVPRGMDSRSRGFLQLDRERE